MWLNLYMKYFVLGGQVDDAYHFGKFLENRKYFY